jgi:exoribonuclease II
LPMESKPPKASWLVEEKVRQQIESLQAYAVDACDDEQRRLAGNVIHQIVLSFYHTQHCS